MADMRVKLFLDLVNGLKPGAKLVKKDLNSIKRAAKELDRTGGGAKLAREIKRIRPAARDAERGVKGVRQATRDLNREPGAAKLARDLERARGSARRLRNELKQSKAAYAGLIAASGRRGKQPGKAEAEGGGGMPLLAAGRALPALALGYVGWHTARATVRGTIGESVTFEKAMAEVKKKVDGLDNPAELAAMERMIKSNAIRYGKLQEDVALMVAEAGAGGVSKADMPEFLRITIAASTAWDASADQASNALAKIRAATQWTNPQLEEFVDKVNALADAGSAKEMDVVDMFQRAGAAAKAAGVDFDTSLAILTAMNNVAIAPETAARGFNQMTARLRTATSQGKKVNEGLKMLGLSAKAVEAGMKKDARGTILDVFERLDKNPDKASAAINIFGREWWDEAARAGQALAEIVKSLKIVDDPNIWKGSAANNLNIQLATTESHLKRLKGLAGDIGDRLGRWALPVINDAVNSLASTLEAMDRHAEDKMRTEQAATKAHGGQALSAEERERMVNDPAFRAQVTARTTEKRAEDSVQRSTDQARLRQLQDQYDQLATYIERRRKRGSSDEDLATALHNLATFRNSIRALDPERFPLDPRKPADQDERHGGIDRAEVMGLQERIRQIDMRLQAIDRIRSTVTNPEDRTAFGADAVEARRRRDDAQRRLRELALPRTFGFGPGGISGGPGMGSLGPGIGFGRQVSRGMSSWADGVRDSFNIDLGPSGATMVEKLAAGITSGGGQAKGAADTIARQLRGAFTGIDMAPAGQAMMATLAAGIRAGAPQAVEAARSAASGVRGASRSRRAISGALHDGVE